MKAATVGGQGHAPAASPRTRPPQANTPQGPPGDTSAGFGKKAVCRSCSARRRRPRSVRTVSAPWQGAGNVLQALLEDGRSVGKNIVQRHATRAALLLGSQPATETPMAIRSSRSDANWGLRLAVQLPSSNPSLQLTPQPARLHIPAPARPHLHPVLWFQRPQPPPVPGVLLLVGACIVRGKRGDPCIAAVDAAGTIGHRH